MLVFSRFALASAVLFAASLTGLSCQAGTRYVSANGTGSAPCTASAPCGFLSTAYFASAVGDTIVCLSSPPAESLAITQSITIECSTARAQIRDFAPQSTPVTGLSINIPVSSNDPLRTVRLRGLTIDGGSAPPGAPSGRYYDRGIDIVAATAVHIEDCVISNVNQQGIYDHRTGGQTRLYIKDSFVSGNGGPGISLVSQAVGITILDNVRMENNSYGMVAAAGNNVVLNRSVISGNTTAGVEADTGAQVEVIRSILSHNTVNVQAFGAIRLRENDIKFSNVAVQGTAAVSMGFNRFSGNGSLGTTPTSATGASQDVFN